MKSKTVTRTDDTRALDKTAIHGEALMQTPLIDEMHRPFYLQSQQLFPANTNDPTKAVIKLV